MKTQVIVDKKGILISYSYGTELSNKLFDMIKDEDINDVLVVFPKEVEDVSISFAGGFLASNNFVDYLFYNKRVMDKFSTCVRFSNMPTDELSRFSFNIGES